MNPSRRIKVVPLAITSVFLALACLVSPLALLTGLLNDSDDANITNKVYIILIVALGIAAAHAVVAYLTLRNFVSVNRLCATAFGVNIAFLISIVLIPLTMLSIILMPHTGTGTSDTSAYILLVLFFMLSTTIVPSLAVMSLILSINLIVNRRSITRTPPVS